MQVGPPPTGDSILCGLAHHLATWALGRADPQAQGLPSPLEAAQARDRCPWDLILCEMRFCVV
eukprot:1368130-Pyramimonas_sp.AAC.1